MTACIASRFLSSVLTSLVLVVLLVAPVMAAGDDVILTTRDFQITEQDFSYYLVERDIGEEQAKEIFAKEGMVKNAIENMYVIKALAIEGANNLEIDKNEIDWLVEHYRERLLMNRHLDLQIAKQMDQADWNALALEHYLGNRSSFNTSEQMDVDHILISMNERTEEEALARAEEVLAKLKDGADFAALAQEYSDDQSSAVQGGRIGPFPKGMMVPPFEVAAFALEVPGELSPPVRSDFGYHIIKLNAYLPPQPQSFEAVKDRLIPEIRKRFEQQTRSDLISRIKSGEVDYGLEVNLPLLEAIEARYGAGPDPNLEHVRSVVQPD